VRCSALQCVTVRYSAWQCVAVRYNVWQCAAVRSSAELVLGVLISHTAN